MANDRKYIAEAVLGDGYHDDYGWRVVRLVDGKHQTVLNSLDYGTACTMAKVMDDNYKALFPHLPPVNPTGFTLDSQQAEIKALKTQVLRLRAENAKLQEANESLRDAIRAIEAVCIET